MATIDDWILQSTGSFLTEEPVADESKYAPELERRYKAITGVDPRLDEVQEFKEGGYEQWMSYGLGEVQYQGSDPSQYFQNLGTKENLAKFGYTAPSITHEQLVARDLAGDYGAYTGGLKAQDTTAKNTAWQSISDEYAGLAGDSEGQQAFGERYGLNPLNWVGGANDDLIATLNKEEVAKMGGYAPTTPKSQDDYYGDKFGRNFSSEQIEGALTGRYGELQGPQDLGKGWEELYQSVDRWRQQDDMWLVAATGANDELFPQAMANQRAAMAAGGLKQGSALWNQNINELSRQRMDIQGTYDQKRQALKESQSYKALEKQYNDLKGTTQKRAKEETRTRYSNEVVFNEATRKWQGARYGRDSETGEQITISEGQWIDTPAYNEVVQTPYEETYQKETDTGDLLYGVDGETPSFGEFWDQNFSGATDVENPYLDRGLSNQTESETDRRARMAASGMVME